MGVCKIICETFANSQVFRINNNDFAVILTNRDYYDRKALLSKLKETYQNSLDNDNLAKWNQYETVCSMAVYAENDKSVEDVLSRI